MDEHRDDVSYLYGHNTNYIEELYAQYVTDRSLVGEAWQEIFDDLASDEAATRSELSIARGHHGVADHHNGGQASPVAVPLPTGRRRRRAAGSRWPSSLSLATASAS